MEEGLGWRDLLTSKGNVVQHWNVIANIIKLTGISLNTVKIIVIEDTC